MVLTEEYPLITNIFLKQRSRVMLLKVMASLVRKSSTVDYLWFWNWYFIADCLNILNNWIAKFLCLCWSNSGKINISEIIMLFTYFRFFMSQKVEKPSLSGHRLKTRKRGKCKTCSFIQIHFSCQNLNYGDEFFCGIQVFYFK